MVSSDSLDEYMHGIVRRYSSLFTLPSQETIVLTLFLLVVLSGVPAVMNFRPSCSGFALGLILGVSLFLITVSVDFLTSNTLLRKDAIFNFRRCSALSLFCSSIWLTLIFLGTLTSILLQNPDTWIRFFLFGFCVVIMLRLVVFFTTSAANRVRGGLSSFLQPTLCVILVFLMAPIIGFSLTASLMLLPPLLLSVVLLSVLLFTLSVDRVGKKTIGIPSSSLFKAFMANWTEDLNAPLENFFERLGSERDIELSMLAFQGEKGIKALIVVPAFHAGPFKNVGSSLFPSMVQEALENKLGCPVSVPHGLFGHSLDLASQAQSRKVLDTVLNSVNFPFFESTATSFVRTRANGASASCQIFENCAFVTLTLAPETMEDLPERLNSFIVGEAEERGMSSAFVVDAHNSIDGPFNIESVVNPLRTAAIASLEEATRCQRRPLQVGAARIFSEEFGIEDGMGPGGISVIVTKVDLQKAAYVTIDANNMISGLREKILSMLRQLDIVEGEILTTDTHAVNGVVLTPRGYHPLGEAIDHSKLIERIKTATTKALNDMEPAKVSWRTETIPNIKVIGEKQIETLCDLTERAAKQAKALAATLFPITGIVLAVLLAFL